jgi:hypothetical protein
LLRLVVEWLRLPEVFLALDATTLGNRWTVLALGVVVHQHTIPIAWKVVRGNTKGAWLPLCEAMRALLRGALPKSMPVYVLTDRGLWSPELFAAIVRNRWHPLMRVNAQGYFRPLWGRRKRALASLCPARAGQQVVIAGEAFRYRLRCTLSGVLGRRGAGAVVSVDGLACACGVWVVVWVSDVDRAGVSLARGVGVLGGIGVVWVRRWVWIGCGWCMRWGVCWRRVRVELVGSEVGLMGQASSERECVVVGVDVADGEVLALVC